MCKLFCRAGHDSRVQNLLRIIQRRNPPCNAEDNLCARLIVIEVWFRDYYGSPRLGGPRTVGPYTLAGLLDYEDTRFKTSSRVRMGLSFAWKASLAICICRFLSLLPTLCNPSPLRCLYKPEGLVCRTTTIIIIG